MLSCSGSLSFNPSQVGYKHPLPDTGRIPEPGFNPSQVGYKRAVLAGMALLGISFNPSQVGYKPSVQALPIPLARVSIPHR